MSGSAFFARDAAVKPPKRQNFFIFRFSRAFFCLGRRLLRRNVPAENPCPDVQNPDLPHDVSMVVFSGQWVVCLDGLVVRNQWMGGLNGRGAFRRAFFVPFWFLFFAENGG